MNIILTLLKSDIFQENQIKISPMFLWTLFFLLKFKITNKNSLKNKSKF